MAVISHSLWSRYFNRQPSALGQRIRLDGQETRIIGIMPASFEFPSPWYDGHEAELWAPLRVDGDQGRSK